MDSKPLATTLTVVALLVTGSVLICTGETVSMFGLYWTGLQTTEMACFVKKLPYFPSVDGPVMDDVDVLRLWMEAILTRHVGAVYLSCCSKGRLVSIDARGR